MHELALHRVIALAAFIWTYFGLALGRIPGFRVDRTGVAIIGAAAMVVTGVILWERSPPSTRTPSSCYRPAVLTAVTTALSNLVSNMPAVLLFRSAIPTFGEPVRGWLILAMASTLAGNLPLLGSVANLIVVEVARGARVRIGFLEYCWVGVPLTLLTLLVGWLFLALARI